MSTHANRVQMTVSGTPGTGTITLNAASSGYRSFATAYGGNATVDILVTEGTSWEVARDCTYTNSGTTVTRGTLESSSTGSAVSFTSAAIVSVIPTAHWGNRAEGALQSVTPGGRLTLESGVPISTTDQTAKTTIYYTPYVHNIINLWDGANWVPTTFAETSEALGTLTSGLAYDVFGFLSAGALDLEKLAWTSGTARATAVTLQDGRYCKSGDKTRLYLGTFYTTSTTTTEDSAGGTTTQVGGKRFLWNAYNRVSRPISVIDTTDSWSYATDTVRQANAASGNKVEMVVGLSTEAVSANVGTMLYCLNNSARAAKVGIGVDSTTAFSGLRQGGYNTSFNGCYFAMSASYVGFPGIGYHYLAWLEKGSDGTSAFLGDNAADGQQSGMIAEVWA